MITQVTFCMSALNLPLTREPLQTWLQTGGIRWDYRPRCPLLFRCPSLASSTRPLPPASPPLSPLPSPLLTRLSSPGIATERPSTGKLKPESLPSVAHFHSHTQTHSHAYSAKDTHTHTITGVFSLFNEGHDGVNQVKAIIAQ